MLLHKCECASLTLIAPLPDILRYLPSTMGGVRQVDEESHTHDATTQAPEVATN